MKLFGRTKNAHETKIQNKFGMPSLAFTPGECPHRKVVWSQVRNPRVEGSKGDHKELSDFHPRKSFMKVSPREVVGYEKVHADGICMVAINSLPGRGKARPATHRPKMNAPRRKTGRPQRPVKAEPMQHIAAGLCGATTKKGTQCQRKARPGELLCMIHGKAS